MIDLTSAGFMDAPTMVATVLQPPYPLSYMPMTLMHLPWVTQVATTLYPDEPEIPHVLFERLTLFPQGCFILWGHTGDPERPHGAVGYLISHPWDNDGSVPLTSDYLERIDFWRARHYVIYDLVILPPAQRHGYGAQAVAWTKTFSAQTFDALDTMTRRGSEPFWVAQGFEPAPVERAFRESEPARAKSGETAHFRFRLP